MINRTPEETINRLELEDFQKRLEILKKHLEETQGTLTILNDLANTDKNQRFNYFRKNHLKLFVQQVVAPVSILLLMSICVVMLFISGQIVNYFGPATIAICLMLVLVPIIMDDLYLNCIFSTNKLRKELIYAKEQSDYYLKAIRMMEEMIQRKEQYNGKEKD